MRARRLILLGVLACAAACPNPSGSGSAPAGPASQSTAAASVASASGPDAATATDRRVAIPPAQSPERSDPKPVGPDADLLRPVFIDASFGTFHQTFLQYGLNAIERSAVWSHFYKNRWVHWSGQLVKVSSAALLFRQLGTTTSYDVLVRVPRIDPGLRRRLTTGRMYNYVGRIDSYDDMFRTIYLEQGQIFDAGPEGVPGVMLSTPPLARIFPPPPRIYAGPPGITIGGLPPAAAPSDPLRPAPAQSSRSDGPR